MFVAIDTTEHREIVRCGMALHAVVPCAFMRPAVDREILLVVVPGRRIPGICCMAVLTGRRKLCCTVVRVIGPIIIGSMASETSCRRVVVIAVGVAFVATGACMCAGQGPVRIVHCKSSRRPVWRGRVAGCAVMG